jgi:TRAP-type C4-dicarboxylate transport system substrate-binding protein
MADAPSGDLLTVLPEANFDISELMTWEERQTGNWALLDELCHEKLNSKLVSYGMSGKVYIFTDFPVTKVADFQGKPVRCYGPYVAAAPGWGMQPITMAGADIYTSMERGVIEGYITIKEFGASLGLGEVTKYIVEPGLFPSYTWWFINLDTWNQLSTHLQDIVLAIGEKHEYGKYCYTYRMEKDATDAYLAAGAQICTMTPEEGQKLLDIAAAAKMEELKATVDPETLNKMWELTRLSMIR